MWDGTIATSYARTLATIFQSTHPVWDGTIEANTTRKLEPNFNPPIPCGMGLVFRVPSINIPEFQSTHPVWDGTFVFHVRRGSVSFQSTHPVWDGTLSIKRRSYHTIHFNPPIPCGMGLSSVLFNLTIVFISIHPSRVGWDSGRLWRRCGPTDFNPPIPCGMGRPTIWLLRSSEIISIHPSRVGWDTVACSSLILCIRISIHPSRVGWDVALAVAGTAAGRFQSTHPVWDGTLSA